MCKLIWGYDMGDDSRIIEDKTLLGLLETLSPVASSKNR